MAPPLTLGTAGWILRSRLPQVSATVLTYQETWHGPYATVGTQVAALRAAGATDISSSIGGAVATLTASFGDGSGGSGGGGGGAPSTDPIATVWNVTPYDVEVDLRQLPALTAASGFGEWAAVADQLIADGTPDIDYTNLPANFEDYVNMRCAGVDSYRRVQFNVTKAVTYYKDVAVDLTTPYGLVGTVIAWADIPGIDTSGLTQPYSTDGVSSVTLEWLVGGPAVQKAKRTQTITYTWQGSVGYIGFLYPGGSLDTKGA